MKIKRRVYTFFAMLFLAAPLYADEYSNEYANAILLGAELAQTLFIGEMGYERALDEKCALLVTAALRFVTENEVAGRDERYSFRDFDVLAHLRIYPLRTKAGKPFLDGGAGYSFLSLKLGDTAVSHLLRLKGAIGWRLGIRRMFLDISAGNSYCFGQINEPGEFSRQLPLDNMLEIYLHVGAVF
ncbi:MAG: hypothetical protein LBC72_05665 [Spirochaetaceae bacterium]|nr:hypothetical protein [Spirochaetaceae bacterium]